MMPELRKYVRAAYRRDVLGESGNLPTPRKNDELIAAIKAELARIDALKLGASLASRDFISYQTRRALERLLAELESQP